MPPLDATKRRIRLLPSREFLLPLLGDWKISLPLLRQELWRGLILNRLMEPNGALSDAHFEIDSIILNAPVADVYAYCSRFEELPVRLCSSIEPATLARVTRDYLMNFKRFVERASMP